MDDQNTVETPTTALPSGDKHKFYKENIEELVLRISDLCSTAGISTLIHFELDNMRVGEQLSSHRVTLLSAPEDVSDVAPDIIMAAKLLDGPDTPEERAALIGSIVSYLARQAIAAEEVANSPVH